MKLCRDLDHPGWIKRIHGMILNDPEMTSRKIPADEIPEDDIITLVV